MISKLLFSCGNILHHVLKYIILTFIFFSFLQLSLYSHQYEAEDKWMKISMSTDAVEKLPP